MLYFTDTLWEDEDLYRFIEEASDKLQLPMLTHSMGVSPIELMFEQKVIFNSRIGNCSKILKMKVAADFLKKGKEPAIVKWRNKGFLKDSDFITDATLYFGISWDEMHREGAIRKNWAPFEVGMPLIEEVIDNNEILKIYNIKQFRLYDYGFTHNNCKGRCVKAGQGHFTNLAEKLPKVFTELMEQEHHLKNYVSAYHYIKNLDEYGFDDDVKRIYINDLNSCYEDYFYGRAEKPKIFIAPNLHMKKFAFMKKQKNNERFPYQLRDLAQDVSVGSKGVDKFDIGGCGCFVEYDGEVDALERPNFARLIKSRLKKGE